MQPFEWRHPEGKDNIFQKEIMKYISLRPEYLGRLELEMKKANANVSIVGNHVAVEPPDNLASQVSVFIYEHWVILHSAAYSFSELLLLVYY